VRTLITAAAVLLLGCYSEFEQPRGKTTTPKKEKAETARTGKATDKKNDDDKKKPEQTYRQAWEVICHAEQRAGIAPALPRMERGNRVAGWLVEHLKNKEARYWLIRFGDTKEEAERRAMLRAEAKKAGITSCPLEGLLFAPEAGPPKGPTQAAPPN
jgi:hypothetical protein